MLFFFNDTATTEIYTLSLHDALPIYVHRSDAAGAGRLRQLWREHAHEGWRRRRRSEEHTSELQSQSNLVCRLLLEKKNKCNTYPHTSAIKILAVLVFSKSQTACNLVI